MADDKTFLKYMHIFTIVRSVRQPPPHKKHHSDHMLSLPQALHSYPLCLDEHTEPHLLPCITTS